MDNSQIKSKERVAERGEVFTAEREVKAMCDLVRDECERLDSLFLEPACGDGNFLAEIISRKLAVAKRESMKDSFLYEVNSVKAMMSIYGVDIMMDNVLCCRERMFDIWNREYTANCKKDANDETREAVRFILSRNIVLGNALSMMCVDADGNDTDEPIIFSDWKFADGSFLVKRRDYRLDVLLRENTRETLDDIQMTLGWFDDDDRCSDYWDFDPIEKAYIPKPIREFAPIHYRRVKENG
ncbi:MAG: restriction endonuclease subunit M [Clostridia bacterium]|nr:restriction endonuclease subunit M [Clostridia bacterium]